ncbi:TerB family tellurite resistance protein [Pelagibacterium montanilacus]|uniref:tellurite resistance TerB family protein n=1 Tax=Pelagibacterium montanilacus TaxID=2185280 RepID=UPI0013DFCA87|nr:TerB family tellurite resistance protein [Pelagibacterium montanilacus]
MFDAIARLFGQDHSDTQRPIEPRLAVAALLVHLAAVDGSAKPQEMKVAGNALKDHYGLTDTQVRDLIVEARRKDREAVDFYQFTSALSTLPPDEKIAIVRMMWQVVFADESNHELEDNMVWRVAELIGVSSRERTVLRNQMRRNADATLDADETSS